MTHENASYPLFRVVASRGTGKNKRNVLISGGVHGDEPAGVHAVLEFLEHHADEYLDRFRFYAYPCINPWGFERHVRDDPEGVNINRRFGVSPGSAESRAVENSLAGGPERYFLTIDMHESGTEERDIYEYSAVISSPPGSKTGAQQAMYIKARESEMPLAAIEMILKHPVKGDGFAIEMCHDEKSRRCVEWIMAAGGMRASIYKIPYEFYLYEYCAEENRGVGARIIEALQHDTPICTWKRIAGDKGDNGVVRWPDGCTNPEYAQMTSFDAFLLNNYTGLAFTTETAKHWSMENRVNTHIKALKEALRSA
ncbi:succinylglutamate desuccinylase/aspartoacylase family protein [Candidatus Woesearchaeota archaeon]|nr:succinylglutamate desuccinylase/aspartoacylase family protein [Candidatus Woesearchaeota archaeon]